MRQWARASASDFFWLERLKEAHSMLLRAIGALEQLTCGPLPSRERLVDVRWALSKASLERRLAWGKIHAYLAARGSSQFDHDLRMLQETDAALLRAAVAHVRTWTTDAIVADWPGYCRASVAMRRKLLDGVQAERALLYPLLEAIVAVPDSAPG